jgi:hypothetical protein
MRFNELPARLWESLAKFASAESFANREKTSLWATPNTKQEVCGDCEISSVCDTFDKKGLHLPPKVERRVKREKMMIVIGNIALKCTELIAFVVVSHVHRER